MSHAATLPITEALRRMFSPLANDDQWITVKPNGPNAVGRPALIGEGGEIKAGMGGKFNGKKIGEIPRTQRFHNYQSGKPNYSDVPGGKEASQEFERAVKEISARNTPQAEKDKAVAEVREGLLRKMQANAQASTAPKQSASTRALGPIDTEIGARMKADRIKREAERRQAGEAWRESFLAKSAANAQEQQAKNSVQSSASKLDADLIRRSNDMSSLGQSGDYTSREYDRAVATISALNLPQADKDKAINAIHQKLTERLQAETKVASPYASGPARLNTQAISKKVDTAAQKSAEAQSIVNRAVNTAAESDRQSKKADKQAEMRTHVGAALESGALEFTDSSGKRWVRPSTRSKTFTAARDAAIALDRATRRSIDANGFLHVSLSHISKETVNPYYGREIPGWEDLGLDPERIYQGYRSGEELAKGAETFNGLPILIGHHAESADNPQKEHRVGSTGTDAVFSAPYLDNSLSITDADAIKAIEDGRSVELSSAYRYEPVFESGEFKGEPYDFIMTNIRGNHVALVEEGRAGPDVAVADEQIKLNPMRKMAMGIKELIAKLKEFIASAEGSGAQMDPDSLAKGKELIGDMDALVNGGNVNKEAQDDELDDLGAEVYALIDTIDDRELAAKIKAKIEEVRASGAATDNDPAAMADPTKATDEVPEDVIAKMEAAGLDPADEAAAKAFMAGMKASGMGGDEDPDPEAEKKATDEDPEPDKKEEKALTAQDAAIIRMRAKREAATETKAHLRSLTDAARSVRELCGELDPFAFDSAADIYRHALKASGRTVTTRDAAALRDMVGMALDAKANAAMSSTPAFDTREMGGAFKGLNRISIQQ